MADRNRRVFVFGAGASHGARTPSPPLGKDLHHYVRKYLCSAWGELHHLEEDAWPPKETVRQELRRRVNSSMPFEFLIGQLIGMRQEWHLLQKLNLPMAYALTRRSMAIQGLMMHLLRSVICMTASWPSLVPIWEHSTM